MVSSALFSSCSHFPWFRTVLPDTGSYSAGGNFVASASNALRIRRPVQKLVKMKRLIETGDVEGIERNQTRVHGCSNKQYLFTHVGSVKEKKG